ncbi:chaperone protein [Neofusicoccum parvum]|uniref:Chaperone protein n=1 Tax=Neofusicoccum parvum TaxID=310453 RepID=A0ACB5S651_9PEZI|nr:chaperone protein [Neofusicoccum parvum]
MEPPMSSLTSERLPTMPTTFSSLPGEVRNKIYILYLNEDKGVYPVYRSNKAKIHPQIYTPAICKTNRAIRAETLSMYMSRIRWTVLGGVPGQIGSLSTTGRREGYVMNLIHRDRNVAYQEWVVEPLDWTDKELWHADDVAEGFWAHWCGVVERMGRAAENGIGRLRIRAYAHRCAARKNVQLVAPLYIYGPRLVNEIGLFAFDVDLVRSGRQWRRRKALVAGRVPARLQKDFDEAEVYLESLLVPLGQKRAEGLMRVADIKHLAETFVKYVEAIGMDDCSKELKAITC